MALTHALLVWVTLQWCHTGTFVGDRKGQELAFLKASTLLFKWAEEKPWIFKSFACFRWTLLLGILVKQGSNMPGRMGHHKSAWVTCFQTMMVNKPVHSQLESCASQIWVSKSLGLSFYFAAFWTWATACAISSLLLKWGVIKKSRYTWMLLNPNCPNVWDAYSTSYTVGSTCWCQLMLLPFIWKRRWKLEAWQVVKPTAWGQEVLPVAM